MHNPLDLTDRTIVVTGASSGIGRGTAVLLNTLGARVVLVGRNEERLNATAGSLQGGEHLVEPFDLTAIDDIAPWFKGIAAKSGPLHGLVHSAGISSTRPLRFMAPVELTDTMRINVEAAVALSRAFCHKRVCPEGGSIVFLSSVMGLVGQPGVASYAASKGALVALAKSLAMELARDRIRVNCVAPGHLQTEMAEKVAESLTATQMEEIAALHPLGIGSVQDVAHAIAFLLADTGRWITGTTLVVDGGYTAH